MPNEANSSFPAWEAALLEESRSSIERVYTNVLDRYLTNERLITGVDSVQPPRIDTDKAMVTDRLDSKNKQVVLTANYGDLSVPIGRYDPARDNFVTFPELLPLEERYLLHEKRIQYILDKGTDTTKRLFPLIVSNERCKQADALAPYIENLLDFYNTVKQHDDDYGGDIYADDATGIYVCQQSSPGQVNISVALEHAFTRHRCGDEVGTKRRALSRIPIITCGRLDNTDSMRREKYVSHEAARTVLDLAREADRVRDSEAMRRRLDLIYMRHN